MVRTAAGTDPLLRRPFSVFEILRDADGVAYRHLGAEQARRPRHDAALRRRRRRPASRASARSASRSRSCRRRPRPGWSRAASGSRRSPRWPSRCRAPARRRAVLRRPHARGPLLPRLVRVARRRARPGDRGRLAGRARPRHGAARRGARARAGRPPGDALRLRSRADAEGGGRPGRAVTAARRRCRPSASWAAASAGATAASCAVRDGDGHGALRALVPERPGVRRRRDRLGVTVDLSVRIGSLDLKNPLIAASGCFGYGARVRRHRRPVVARRASWSRASSSRSARAIRRRASSRRRRAC